MVAFAYPDNASCVWLEGLLHEAEDGDIEEQVHVEAAGPRVRVRAADDQVGLFVCGPVQ